MRGDIKMHEESSQISLPVPRVSYAPPTHSLVGSIAIEGQRAATIQSCHAMLCQWEMCVRGALIHDGCVVRVASDELLL